MGLVYTAARDLFSRVAGVAAAAGLIATYVFFRHARFAEADGPATLFVTAAIWGMWKGLRPRAGESTDILTLHLSAIALALAMLSKQGAVVFPLVFLILWALVERRRAIVGRWILSGAPLTFLIVGAPWFLYTGHLIGWSSFLRAFKNVTDGSGRFNWPTAYLPMLLQGTLPWVGLTTIALVTAIRRWQADERIRVLLTWCGSIFVPLLIAGNKQMQYLVPLMPPLAILVGWLIEQTLHEERKLDRDEPRSPELSAVRWAVGITMLISLLAAGAVFFIGFRRRGAVSLEDVICSGSLLLVSVWGLAIFIRKPALAAMFGVCATAAVFPYTIGRWIPSLELHDHRALATHLRHRLPLNPRYCFYGKSESVPLIFALKQIVTQYETEAALREAIIADPRLVVIGRTKNGMAPLPIPAQMEEFYADRLEDQSIRVYVVPHKPAATSPASRATQPSVRRGGSTRPASGPR